MAEKRFTPKNHEEPQRRILFIDDDEDNCQLLKVYLEDLTGSYIVGYETKSRKALEAIHDFKPDLVLLESGIPPGGGDLVIGPDGCLRRSSTPPLDLDGPAIAELIMEDPELGGLPIILLCVDPPPLHQVKGADYPWIWLTGPPEVALNDEVTIVGPRRNPLDYLTSCIEKACAGAPGPSWRKREPPTTEGVS